MMVCGVSSILPFVREWLQDKHNLVLVTGRASYVKCGAAAFFKPLLDGKNVIHLTTIGENARVEDVSEKRSRLPAQIDGFIAVGGGTVLDTVKLLRNGFPDEVKPGVPYLAVPTTAGTGAEATRFAVYYDQGRKCSADNELYLPTDVALLPEFTLSQTSYQRASTEFDAFAQAIESVWAKQADSRSLEYARSALQLFSQARAAQIDADRARAQQLGAYWSGRAIDISRTTAAHAFSYYLTAKYGIPHGHAVYMVFPYILGNNADCLEAVGLKRMEIEAVLADFHDQGLETLTEFVERKRLDWTELVDALFFNVNLTRLGNNPCEVRREAFQ